MQIHKFGGASLKTGNSIRNLCPILKMEQHTPTIIIISALGKTTNALEDVLLCVLNEKKNILNSLQPITDFHISICKELFVSNYHFIYKKVKDLLDQLKDFCLSNTSKDYNYVYDQIVCYGELLSTTIISFFLNSQGISNNWIDVRKYIITDNTHRKGTVLWDETIKEVKKLDLSKLIITQGFIASNIHGKTTTLGREGSDYSAAIFSFCLKASGMTIWKDVPGVLNADPKKFDNTVLLEEISFEEAVELAFYGASVIHPKTIQPLRQKNIELRVKSFKHPNFPGTLIKKGIALKPKCSCLIVKENQMLLKFSDKNFGFITENHIGEIFRYLDRFNFRVYLMQNSALHFSLCVEDKFNQLNALYKILSPKYNIEHIYPVSLYTIRHYKESDVLPITKGKHVLLRQAFHNTLQLIISAV